MFTEYRQLTNVTKLTGGELISQTNDTLLIESCKHQFIRCLFAGVQFLKKRPNLLFTHFSERKKTEIKFSFVRFINVLTVARSFCLSSMRHWISIVWYQCQYVVYVYTLSHTNAHHLHTNCDYDCLLLVYILKNKTMKRK